MLDTPCLNHFTRADRIDVLADLLVGDDCRTTILVVEELRTGARSYPVLHQALDLPWLSISQLNTPPELVCFAKWARRIGSGERDLGEASVLALAELTGALAISDDREAVAVGRAHGVRVHGTVWLLARACRDGKLTEGAAGSLVTLLRESGMRLPCTGAGYGDFVRGRGLL